VEPRDGSGPGSLVGVRTRGSVLVAMSGGVDSAVAACLLARGGYAVTGVHLELVPPGGEVDHGCCGPTARADAERSARAAGIPFEVVDVSEVFERTVLADFVAEHRAGRTPNPCIGCNAFIKFGAFMALADVRGVEHVATGHHARRVRAADGTWRLFRAVDRRKDQSYLLHILGQAELARSLFPIGERTKAEVRELAAVFGLPVAAKPDSQELCFAPSGRLGAFVRTTLPELVRPGGEVVDPDGRVLAGHDGTFAFTVGQRRGLGVATGSPVHVLELDARRNRVVVGPAVLLERVGVVADRVRWVAGAPPEPGPFEATAQLRAHGEGVASVARVDAGRLHVSFSSPQRGVAPGQSVVLYRGDEVLGGGRIVETLRS
jgi:tRNA-specific 2-thiouridylase